jgi:hypothetical protein
MNGRGAWLLTAGVLLAIVLVGWLGYEYRNEAHAFLRALLRAVR